MNNEEELRKDLAFTIWLLEQMELYPEQYSEFNKIQLGNYYYLTVPENSIVAFSVVQEILFFTKF